MGTGHPRRGCLAGGGAVYCGARSGTIVCFDAEDGMVRWQGSDGFPWAFGDPVAVVGHQVYVRDSSRKLRALDARTGASLWTAPWGEKVDRIVLSGSTAYADEGSLLWAIDLKTHETRWTRPVLGYSVRIANDSTLYNLDLDGVTAFDARNGTSGTGRSTTDPMTSPAASWHFRPPRQTRCTPTSHRRTKGCYASTSKLLK